MTDRITLDGIDPQQFDSFIDLLAKWLVEGQVKVRVRIPAQVEFSFAEEQITQRLKDAGLPSACLGQLRLDIPVMLSAILTGHRKAVTRFLVGHVKRSAKGSPSKPTEAQIRQELEARSQHVEEKIVSTELRHQYSVKRTAKTSTYIDTSWEVVLKQQDSVQAALLKQAYVTLRITGQKQSPRAGDLGFVPPFAFDILDSPKYEELVLAVTPEDLEDLVDSLSKALKALKEANTIKRES